MPLGRVGETGDRSFPCALLSNLSLEMLPIQLCITSSLHLYDSFHLNSWWSDNSRLSNLQRFSKFIGEVLLQLITTNLVIFVDEIDSVLSLKFNIDDFFAVIRDCYNKRADNPDYRRLTFTLIGVATPSDLIQDKRRTPFNIGRAIELTELDPPHNGALNYNRSENSSF